LLVMSLREEIKKANPFDAVEQEALLNLVRTADVLAGQIAETLKPFALSATQYNVLRILRGAGQDGLPCGEVAARMITRDPDVTRLLDRMEKRKLISRSREKKDRRVVCARITETGRKLLAELDPIVLAAHRKQLGHMTADQLRQLIELLELSRRQHQQPTDKDVAP
jgi:DNA-binding MarR family transcriptional regulator